MREFREELRDKYLIAAFWKEFYRVTEDDHRLIRLMIKSRLGGFEEAADVSNIVSGCIADIEGIIASQFNAKPGERRNNKERARKLAEFSENPDYVSIYVFEATRSFCRKKRYYWTHGKNKAKEEIGENHKEIKAGRAAREHGKGDTNQVHKWIESLATAGFGASSMKPDTIEEIEVFLRKTGLNDNKIRVFWDRFEGLTFVEMAERDSNKNATPDKYRKRYRRLMERLESKYEKFKELMMADFK